MGLYDSKGRPILTQLEHPVNLHLKSYQQEGHLGIVDSSVLGHMGVYYVVIEETTFLDQVGTLTTKILLAFAMIFILIAAIGYRLAKIFIKPIQNEREKRNNFIKDSTHELNTPITTLLMSISAPDLTSPKNIE
jgi:two-component system OmpR family sensor kinase